MLVSQLEPDQWYLRIGFELCSDSIPGRAIERARVFDIKGLNRYEGAASPGAGQTRITGSDDGTYLVEAGTVLYGTGAKCTTHFASSTWISA